MLIASLALFPCLPFSVLTAGFCLHDTDAGPVLKIMTGTGDYNVTFNAESHLCLQARELTRVHHMPYQSFLLFIDRRAITGIQNWLK